MILKFTKHAKKRWRTRIKYQRPSTLNTENLKLVSTYLSKGRMFNVFKNHLSYYIVCDNVIVTVLTKRMYFCSRIHYWISKYFLRKFFFKLFHIKHTMKYNIQCKVKNLILVN